MKVVGTALKYGVGIILACVFALLLFAGCGAAILSLGASNVDPIDEDIYTSVGEVDPSPSLKVEVKSEKPAGTKSQMQALKGAEEYLQFMSFSKKGLIRQLSSDAGSGFSVADATWAVNRVKVDWKEQAVKSAQDYLTIQSFSRSALIRQLSSSAGSGFTLSEAKYAADKVGL